MDDATQKLVDPYTDEALYGRQDCDCDGSDDHPYTCDLHRQA